MMRWGMTLVLTAILLQGTGVQAGNLDKESCARLEEEQVKLEKAGLRATLAKGAAWAKDNLPLAKLQEVGRLIDVDEQILFRCQGKPLVLLPSSVDADPVVTEETGPEGEKPADGKAVPAKAAPAKDAKAPAPKAAAVVKSDGTPGEIKADVPAKKAPPAAPKATAPVQAKQKDAAAKPEAVTAAKPKAAPKKVDDAYKPPQGDAGQSPFGVQDTNRSGQ
jgi:hypothetical protein